MKNIEPSDDNKGSIYIKGELSTNYFVTKTSEIWSKRSKKFLKQHKSGYCQTSISHNNKSCYVLPHRLAAMAFIPNPNNLPEVNHINGNKHDNRIENLEWVTGSQNVQHATDTGLIKKAPLIAVVQYALDGKKIAEYESVLLAAESVNGQTRSINNVCKGKTVTAYNYRWTYKCNEFVKLKDNRRWRPVVQLTPKTNKIVKTFDTVSLAANFIGVGRTAMYTILKTGTIAAKYRWEYATNDALPVTKNAQGADLNFDRFKNVKINDIEMANYLIDDKGSLYSKLTKSFKNLNTNSTGYYNTLIHENKKKRSMMIHRLVAMTFIPNPHNYPIVNHIDGNKLNNDVNNLEWCTPKQNSQHAHDTGLVKKFTQPVAQYSKDAIFMAEFDSIKDAAIKTNVTPVSISAVCRKKMALSGGFMWTYKSDPAPQSYKKARHYKSKKINQIDPVTKDIVRVHESIIDASVSVDTSTTSIRNACLDIYPLIKGYNWKFA